MTENAVESAAFTLRTFHSLYFFVILIKFMHYGKIECVRILVQIRRADKGTASRA